MFGSLHRELAKLSHAKRLEQKSCSFPLMQPRRAHRRAKFLVLLTSKAAPPTSSRPAREGGAQGREEAAASRAGWDQAVHLPRWWLVVHHAQVHQEVTHGCQRCAASRGTCGGSLNLASQDLSSDTTDLDKALLDVDLAAPNLDSVALDLQLLRQSRHTTPAAHAYGVCGTTVASFRGKMGSWRRWACIA
jgi:hypothetical protein